MVMARVSNLLPHQIMYKCFSTLAVKVYADIFRAGVPKTWDFHINIGKTSKMRIGSLREAKVGYFAHVCQGGSARSGNTVVGVLHRSRGDSKLPTTRRLKQTGS